MVGYPQTDVLTCEKMNAFEPNGNLHLNLAIDISTNALKTAFPDQYGYANTSAPGALTGPPSNV